MKNRSVVYEAMNDADYKKSVQKLCEDADKSGLINKAGVARASGFTPSGLDDFRKTGRGGIDKIRELERVLRTLGFGPPLPANITPINPRAVSVNTAISSQFRAVADIIDSALPQKEKNAAYLGFIREHLKALKAYKAELEKLDDD